MAEGRSRRRPDRGPRPGTPWLLAAALVWLGAGCSLRPQSPGDDDDDDDTTSDDDDDDTTPPSGPSLPPRIEDLDFGGMEHPSGTPVTVTGRFSDPDTPLSELRVWFEVEDGSTSPALSVDGSGSLTAQFNLPDGEARILVRVDDGTGSTAETRIVFWVGPVVVGDFPECAITSPLQGQTLLPGPVALSGRVTDTQDDPEELVAIWSIDGLAEVASLAPSADGTVEATWEGATPGSWVVRLSGEDLDGQGCDATAQVTVCDGLPWFEDTDGDGYGAGDATLACS
jgi:hypothetical protein